jgi:hypothetical protein
MTGYQGQAPIEVLWCGNVHGKKGPGWSFPRPVERLLRELTTGERVLHFFGGRSRWGVRLDIDTRTKPHVVADAWLPPFVKDSFDVVILDPPYLRFSTREKTQLLKQAAFIAKRRIIWFHTIWIYSARSLPMERAWLVRVGDMCAVRCLQVFKVEGWKDRPIPDLLCGPVARYGRWLSDQRPLNFSGVKPPL